MVFPTVMYGCESWTIKKAAAAAAKLHQSCPTLSDPIDGSPLGSHLWDSLGKNTGVGCHCLFRKKAEYPIIDAFELWCWKRLLRVPWTARISDQSIPKEISPECSLEGLMLKLKLQYFGHLMQRADSFEKILIPGKIEVRRRRGWEDEMVGWHHWLSGHELE